MIKNSSVKGMKEVFRNWPYYNKILQGFQQELSDYNHIIPNLVEYESTFTKSLGIQSDIV